MSLCVAWEPGLPGVPAGLPGPGAAQGCAGCKADGLACPSPAGPWAWERVPGPQGSAPGHWVELGCLSPLQPPCPHPSPLPGMHHPTGPSPQQLREGAGLRSAPESSARDWVSSSQDVSTGARWAGAGQGRASQSEGRRLERNARPCAGLLLVSVRPAARSTQLSPTFLGQRLEAQGRVTEAGSKPRVRLQGPEKPGQLGGADSRQDTGALPAWVGSWGLSLR